MTTEDIKTAFKKLQKSIDEYCELIDNQVMFEPSVRSELERIKGFNDYIDNNIEWIERVRTTKELEKLIESYVKTHYDVTEESRTLESRAIGIIAYLISIGKIEYRKTRE